MFTPPRSLFLFFLLILTGAGCDPALDHPDLVKYGPSQNAVLFQNVKIFNGESPSLRRQQDLLVQDGFIREIANTGKIKAPKGAKIIEGKGRILMPGLVDAHVHLGSNGAVPWNRVRPDPAFNLEAYLYAGITTVYDLGGIALQLKNIRKRVEEGKIPGPSIYFTHIPITVERSHPIPMTHIIMPPPVGKLAERMIPTLEHPEEAREMVRDHKKKGVHYIKIIVDQLPPGTPEMGYEKIKAVVNAAHDEGLRVLAHIGSGENAVNAVQAGVDALAHGVYRGQLTNEQADIIAEAGIPVIWTATVYDHFHRISQGKYHPAFPDTMMLPDQLLHPVTGNNAMRFYHYPLMEKVFRGLEENHVHWETNFQKLRERGVTILVGTDSSLPGTYAGAAYYDELKLLEEYGMSPYQVLKGATSEAAGLFLDDPSFGSIEEGKRADLLLVPGSPLKDLDYLKYPSMIMARGRIVERKLR